MVVDEFGTFRVVFDQLPVCWSRVRERERGEKYFLAFVFGREAGGWLVSDGGFSPWCAMSVWWMDPGAEPLRDRNVCELPSSESRPLTSCLARSYLLIKSLKSLPFKTEGDIFPLEKRMCARYTRSEWVHWHPLPVHSSLLLKSIINIV